MSLQAVFDSRNTVDLATGEHYQRADLGQVWTPNGVALEMARNSLNAYPGIRNVLDPACGPATFSRALHAAGATGIQLFCYDVDERMTGVTALANRELGFGGAVRLQDYLADTSLRGKFDLVIMNPPYIRHESIPTEVKDTCHKYLSFTLNGTISRRANLFALFLLKGLVDLAPGGILCAIVYDAITQASYGDKVLKLIERHAELISRKHVTAPFDGVLIDAQIVMYRKLSEPIKNKPQEPEVRNDLMVPISELLETRRGTGLPKRKIFLANPADPYYGDSEPFFIKQARLSGLVIVPDHRAYLIESTSNRNSKIGDWLQQKANSNNMHDVKLVHQGVKGPIAFNYYIRDAPRHLWNPTNVAISDNFYVSSTKDGVPPELAWFLLNSEQYLSRLLSAARNQGDGLSKLQLYEYKNVRVPDWRVLQGAEVRHLLQISSALIKENADYKAVRSSATEFARVLD